MIVATWNVNSVRVRLEQVLRYLEARGPDVLCLQEVKVADGDFPREPFADRGYHAVVAGQRSYNGVAIISREEPADPVAGLPHLAADHPFNGHRRLLAATVSGVRVLSAYLPNGKAVGSAKFSFKLQYIRELRAYLDRDFAPADSVCLAGDFNVAPEPRDVYDPRAWEGRVLCSEPERHALEELREFGFEDCFRRHHPEEGCYSWWDYRGGAFWKGRGLRIDHLWATSPLAACCTASGIDVSPRKWRRPSDHAPVWARFASAPPAGEPEAVRW